MGLLGDVFGGIGSLLGGSGDDNASKDAWNNLNPEAGPTDPKLRQQQLDTLAALRSIASSGGMRTQDKVAYTQAANETNRAEAARRHAVLTNMASRGMAGSGNELASDLIGEQGAADRNAMTGNQAASDANQRALTALSAGGQYAGAIRGQDDAMSRFNAGQRVAKAAGQSGIYERAGQRGSEQWGNLGSSVGNDIGDAAGPLLKKVPIIGGLF